MVSEPCIPLNVNDGESALPTATDACTAVTVGAAYLACELTVAVWVVELAFVVVTVTVDEAPAESPETVRGSVEPEIVPELTEPAEADGVNVVPTA